MSYDLTLWYAPRLNNFDRAMAHLERPKKPSPRERASLRGVVEALTSGPLVPDSLSTDPAIDEASGTVGLALTASAAQTALDAMLPILRRHGVACYDPQEAVVYYPNGADSRAEKAPDGVHEGVYICVAELRGSPPVPEQLDAIDALLQFTLADSPDTSAAAALALPALLALGDSPHAAVRDAARLAAIELRETLEQRGISS